jgi:predicted phosphoribosyltransferase
MQFADRSDAGRRLAGRLSELNLVEPVVVALPRGGVPVGLEVARTLAAPLDIILVRKIGAPGHEELAAGAVVDGESPQLVLNADVVRSYGIDQAWLDQQQALQLQEIARRRQLYLGDRPRAPVAGRTAIVVDDGIATGATIRVALRAMRRLGPKALVLAVPVAAAEVLTRLAGEADRLVCLHTPRHLVAVGQFYRDFRQVQDAEVVAMLKERWRVAEA